VQGELVVLLGTSTMVLGQGGYGGATGGLAPAYRPPSTGYGVPLAPLVTYDPTTGYAGGGGGQGGYAAPCDSYGCGGDDSPVYVYQPNSNGGGGGGGGGGHLDLLGKLLPLGGLALLAPLALFTLFTIFPTTAIVSGRRRREAAGSTLAEERSAVLGNYLAAREWGGAAALQRDMAAQYLQGAAGGQEQAIPGCLEQLACTYLDPTLAMEDQEREVAAIVLQTLADSQLVDGQLKRRLEEAGERALQVPGSCHLYRCPHRLL